MLVSIIVPNYNHARFIQKRLDSIYGQSYADFEVILLDDKSSDDSPRMLQQYANHPKTAHVVINETNSGSPFAQWARGIELAKGELIWIAESDDHCALDFLKRLTKPFLEDDGVVLSYSNSILVDDEGERMGDTLAWHRLLDDAAFEHDAVFEGTKFISNYMLRANIINNASAVLFKKSTLLETNLPDAKYRQVGDYDFWLRLLALGRVAYHRDFLNYYRKGSASVTVKHHGRSEWVVSELFEVINAALSRMTRSERQHVQIRAVAKERVWMWLETKKSLKHFGVSHWDRSLMADNPYLRKAFRREFFWQYGRLWVKRLMPWLSKLKRSTN